MFHIFYLILTLGVFFCFGCTERSAQYRKMEDELRHIVGKAYCLFRQYGC